MLVVLLFVVVATGVLSIANTQRHHIVGRLHTHIHTHTQIHTEAHSWPQRCHSLSQLTSDNEVVKRQHTATTKPFALPHLTRRTSTQLTTDTCKALAIYLTSIVLFYMCTDKLTFVFI